jgi:hypothetical protein
MINASVLVIAGMLLSPGHPIPEPPHTVDLSSVSLSAVERDAYPDIAAKNMSGDVDREAQLSIRPALHRPRILPLMYVSRLALQGYDAYSTFAVLSRGGVEANPLMKGATHPAVFLAVKGATSALTIAVAERLWRRQGRRKAAVALLVVTNSLLAISAAHNATVLHRLQAAGR